MKRWFLGLMRRFGEKVRQTVSPYLDDHVASLDARLVSAGEPEDVHGLELLGMQILSAMVFPVVWGMILSHIPWFDFLFNGPHQILVFLALIALGFFFPYAYVGERIAARHKAIGWALPDMVDILTVCVEAGLDFIGALRVVTSKQKDSPLKDEVIRFLKQLELGKTRGEGLREMSDRINLPDVSSVTSALIQADRLGSPIASVLRSQSDILRTRRGQKAEKAAMEATVKLLAPLVLCILPAVFIMILAPVVIQMIGNLR